MHRSLWLPFPFLLSCTDPAPSPIPPAVTAGAELGSVSFEPQRDDGLVSPIVRLTIGLSSSIAADALRGGRVVLIAGGATEEDAAAYAKNRTTSALRAKEIPLLSWGAPTSGPTSIVVQPSRKLPAGKSTLLVLLERRAPWSLELAVAEDAGEIARRTFPIATTTRAPRATYCASGLPPLPESIAHPTGSLRVVRHALPANGAACFDLIGEGVTGMLVPPPALGGLLVDPQPVAIDPALAVPDDTPCPDGVYTLPGLCVRVEDDRLILLGDVASPRLALGTLFTEQGGARSVIAPLEVGARVVVRGLSPWSDVTIDLLARDLGRDRRARRVVRTAPWRAHLVVNELLARPPSGSASQRFLELANDSAAPLSLGGLFVHDGDDEIELPDEIVPAGALVLLTPEKFVDGLAGEVPPPGGVLRLWVDSLRLTGEISVTDVGGRVLSRFPASTSTKMVARGRRTPEHPDDAADAFGWDRDGRATPGRANSIAP